VSRSIIRGHTNASLLTLCTLILPFRVTNAAARLRTEEA
jgi:hypothetical protein